MGKVVIISDIHHRHRHVDTILGWEEPYDRAIFLGDVQDSFGDTPELALDAARWLKQSLANHKHTHLVGNHDFAYIYPLNGWAYCSGFEEGKSKAIRAVLNQDELESLRLYTTIPGYNILFSHAGLTMAFLQLIASRGYSYPEPVNSLAAITKWLDQTWPEVKLKYQTGGCHPLMLSGIDRGGDQRYGGILWNDISGHMPIPGVGQIVGHTPVAETGPLMRIINKDGAPMWRTVMKHGVNPRWLLQGWTLDIDTHSKHYAVIEGSRMTIKEVVWLKGKTMGQPTYSVEPGPKIATIDLTHAMLPLTGGAPPPA